MNSDHFSDHYAEERETPFYRSKKRKNDKSNKTRLHLLKVLQFLRVFFVTGVSSLSVGSSDVTRNTFEDQYVKRDEPTLAFDPMKSLIRPMGIAGAAMRRPITVRSSLRRTNANGGDRGLKRTR